MSTEDRDGPAPGLMPELLDPATYQHAVAEPIVVVETHISWILLTGEFAYKVKKPLRLTFLDYSTLAERRRLCEEELRLNQRCAPGLYLGVIGIHRQETGLRVSDELESAVEYAVRMRQFDRQQELDALIRSDAATEGELRELGAGIAGFHATAARVKPESTFGRPANIHRITRDNLAELTALPEASAWRSGMWTLESMLDASFNRIEPLMNRRRAAGWIRECHGDMHCANVVRWENRLLPFDGIEFDPALRFIDVISDVAFLTMDLHRRGRAGLRHAVLDAWVAGSGDFEGLELLPYYETYRALVRAKVAAVRALQQETGSPARQEAAAESGDYLNWAIERWRRGPPRLLLTCGLSGSGKSWLARRIAPEILALQIRSDVERKRLAGLAPLESSRSPPDAGIYTLEYNERTYARLREAARSALAGGESVFVDAAFLRAGERLAMLELARDAGVDARILHCSAPMDILRRRVEERSQRRDDASEAGTEILGRQSVWWEPFTAAERAAVLEIDTSAPDVSARTLNLLRS